MIRLAKTGDIPEIVSFLRMCVEDQGFLDIGYNYNPQTIAELSQYLIEVEGFLSLKTDNGKIIGCIACKVGPTVMDTNTQMACEAAWNVHPELSNYKKMKILMELLEQALIWANLIDLPLYMGTNKDNTALERLLLKKGFQQQETLFLLTNKEE